MFNGGTRKRMLTSSPMDPSSPSPLSYPPLPSTTPSKQVKLETPDVKQHEVSDDMQPPPILNFLKPQAFPSLSLGDTKERGPSYLWPGFQPPHYHLLWPGRPLPFLPTDQKEEEPPHLATGHRNEPFFGLFFANNNLTKALAEEKRDDPVSKFMDGPFFR